MFQSQNHMCELLQKTIEYNELLTVIYTIARPHEPLQYIWLSFELKIYILCYVKLQYVTHDTVIYITGIQQIDFTISYIKVRLQKFIE